MILPLLSRGKAGTITTIISILAVGSVYIGYRLYVPYKQIRYVRDKLGVQRQCESLTNLSFARGEWKGIPIDKEIAYTDGAHNIVPYDIDSDGKIELIANSYRSDTVIFYRYNGNPHETKSWSRFVIDPSVGGGNPRPRGSLVRVLKKVVKQRLLGGFTGGAHYTAIADINNDGRHDLVVAADCKNYDIVWYETPKDITDTSKWAKHVAYRNDAHRTYHVETGDINGDGHIDIIFTTKTDNSIGWLQNNGESGNWPIRWVDTSCIRCFNARVADTDKDGRGEILASEDDSLNGGIIHIYRFVGDPREENAWIDHSIAHFPRGEGVSVFEIIDVDGDDDLDLVTANHQGDIYILVNPYPRNTLREWNRYRVTGSVIAGRDFREIDVGDIDNDGDLDIIVADEGQNQVIWFENDGCTFYDSWREHIVDRSEEYLRWCHSVDLGDIDGDGDLDIAVATAASNVFLWYSNERFRKE